MRNSIAYICTKRKVLAHLPFDRKTMGGMRRPDRPRLMLPSESQRCEHLNEILACNLFCSSPIDHRPAQIHWHYGTAQVPVVKDCDCMLLHFTTRRIEGSLAHRPVHLSGSSTSSCN
jgi:hypothetical protein